MTKEQLKYYIDNLNNFSTELNQKLLSIPQDQLEIFENIEINSVQDVSKSYEILSKFCKAVLEKYQISLEAFTILILLQDTNREKIIGREKNTHLLKDIIDIYGEQANDILGLNGDFDISALDSIVDEVNNDKYIKFYKAAAVNRCKEDRDLSSLNKTFLSINPKILSEGFYTEALSNIQYAKVEEINEFIENVPAKVLNGNTLKMLLSKIKSINDNYLNQLLSMIPTEMYDRELATQLLEKMDSEYGVFTVFRSIPSEIKDIEMYQYAISKNNNIAYELPKEKIAGMSDSEYQKWCEEEIIGTLSEETDFNKLMSRLPEHLITERICTEFIRRMPDSNKTNILELFEEIPESYKNRALYEDFIQKAPGLISEIPEKTIEEGLTQKEYDKWVEEIILEVISKSEELEKIIEDLPRIRYSEKVWNRLMDKATELGQEKVSIERVPIQNRTIEMYERALKEISYSQMNWICSIDRNLDEVSKLDLKKEYESWISGLTEEQKQEYRSWYEEKVISFMTEHTMDAYFIRKNRYCINLVPKEAVTAKMIKVSVDVLGIQGIETIPVPDEFTKYNAQYENIVLYAINMLEEKKYLDTSPISERQSVCDTYDVLDKIPKEYRTDKVIMEAIKKHCKYLDYADIESDNFEELLNIGYKNKLDSMGRTTLSKKEIELMKKFARNNSSLFLTLNLGILNPEIISSISESSIERIARYPDVQRDIINLARNKAMLTTFGFTLENLKQDNLFIEPLIEQLSKTINGYEVYEFVKLASTRIQNNSNLLTEEEKTIILYLSLNPQESKKIKNYDEILNFVKNKNAELDKVINSQDVTLIAAKNAYFERIVGMNYDSVLDLINKYGNDPEQLLAKYEGKKIESYKEKSEKESLEIIIKLKSLIEENDLGRIRQAYQEAIEREDKTKSFERYKQFTILDRTLRRAYGRDFTRALNENNKENNTESIEYTEDGREYVVKKLNEPFSRMISVMDAYRKSEASGDMYDRWNTSTMAENHALCYSFINECNPGTAMLGSNKEGIVISISDFDAEAVIAEAPYDLCSDSRSNTTVTYRQQKFYTADNLPDQTRGRYSEVDIEIQDVSKGDTEYKKIQPTSIICFEEIDEDSINAAIELSAKLGKTIPIELIDRRELANQTRTEIDTLLEQFKNGKSLQPELIGQIITKFNNIRNAHMDSNLTDELLGEKKQNENLEALFNKSHLNEMHLECIEIVNERIKQGNVQEGLDVLAQIKNYINLEREKSAFMPSMYEKYYMAGIDLMVDQQIDRIQRENGVVKNNGDNEIECLSIVRNLDETDSITYQMLYDNESEQLSFDEVKQMIDLDFITHSLKDVKEKGYYSENKKYSEEHIARVMIFSSVIANMEGLDIHQKNLLIEVAKYYSSGRLLDIKEAHEQYSAEIAGKELDKQYSNKDIGIIQAVIELQAFSSNNYWSASKQDYKIELDDICTKYKISSQDKTQVDTLTKIISDAVTLDKTRFISNTKYNGPDEHIYGYATKSATKLKKFSYAMQDKIASEHLKAMENVAYIDFDRVKQEIMEEFFTEISPEYGKRETEHDSIIKSPIVREMFFKYKFSEIDAPEILGLQLSEGTNQIEEKENFKETDSNCLLRAYQENVITQEDVRRAYEQLSRTKNNLEHLQEAPYIK